MIMTSVADQIRHRLLALPSGETSQLEGASKDEIDDLEAYAGCTLPAVYKDFLSHLGRSAGELLRGSDYSVSERFHLRLKEYAEKIVKLSTSSYTLPPSAFVFLMSQGYQFAFFHTDQGDDPSVYCFHEGDEKPQLIESQLSRYLVRCIEACEERERQAK